MKTAGITLTSWIVSLKAYMLKLSKRKAKTEELKSWAAALHVTPALGRLDKELRG